MFMCKLHWFKLPKAMRDEVWTVYVPGQEQRMDPSEEYIEVTQRIIDWLARAESLMTGITDEEIAHADHPASLDAGPRAGDGRG